MEPPADNVTDSGNADHNETLPLLDHHLKQLAEESGISLNVVKMRGYRSIHGPGSYSELKALDFNRAQCRLAPGLLVPVLDIGGQPVLSQFRPDTPRLNKDGKPIRYETPAGAAMRLDFGVEQRELLADPKIILYVTEGIKKRDALQSRGLCAVALLGVWNFKGRNPYGGVTFLADWDYIGLNGREVRIVFDNDVMVKPSVRKALKRLTEHLQRADAHVTEVYLPQEGGKKVGVDDYLRTHTVEDFEGLVEAPRPEPRAAPPTVKLLVAAPPTISRPLALIEGESYATTWLYTETTTTEYLNNKGEIVKLDPPIVEHGRRLFIVRSDGVVFADVSNDPKITPLSELGLTVRLPEIPPDSRLWSAPAVARYRLGRRPDPCTAFDQVVIVVDHFIDFNRSLAEQRTMCELVACYILSTWFLDAFTVIGYLWPNGPSGSGKTQLLNVVTELAYLGQTLQGNGSFATLRDLADYGATLAFDDVEHLANPKQMDPDKRELLLAGNRRGNSIPVKEPAPNGTWRTRYVNTFCPRLFSAIRLPDAVLASRAIVVPLIRTPDRAKANRDPLDYAVWPYDRHTLKDDLWALALANLPDLPAYVAQVNELATLTGRNLEPWRPLLAVARWLEEAGVAGLWQRLETLSQAYQQERPDLESGDLTSLIVRTLCHCASRASSANSASSAGGVEWIFVTAEIKAAALTIADESELPINKEHISSERVGRVLGQMRFKQEPRSGGRGSRKWRISLKDLEHLAKAYGFSLPDELGGS